MVPACLPTAMWQNFPPHKLKRLCILNSRFVYHSSPNHCHMFTKTKLVILLLCFAAFLQAQQPVIPLYKGTAPGSENWDWKETTIPKNSNGLVITHNVVTPTLTVYTPEAGMANGSSLIICPGGGFHILSMNTEGWDVAAALVKKGVTCFVLKYRLAHTLTNDPMQEMMSAIQSGDVDKKMEKTIPLSIADGKAAIAYVREHATELGINPNRIGIMGFSAGGTVAGSAAFNYTPSNKPDFVAPVYAYMPAVLMGTVAADAPPMFLVAASDDQLNLQTNSVDLYTKWNSAKKSAELHLYTKGGHGFGMRNQNIPTDTWLDRFTDWMGLLGFLKK